MVNGVITYDNSAVVLATKESPSPIPTNPHHYYAFVRRKVKLTDIGLYILESIKGERYERRLSEEIRHGTSHADPRHPNTIT